MSSLSRPLATFAAALLVASVVPASAAPQRAQHLQLRPAAKAGLLQAAEEAQDTFGKKGPAFDVQWFAEDAQRIAQMPPTIPTDPKRPVCNPICTYSCGHSECDQTCEPLCLPPQCETLCTKSQDKCATKCSKPKCAVICPLQAECTDDHACPKAKCRTICAPPACTTSCSGSCHSVCTQPQCSWKCKKPACPKPECKMNCPKHDCVEDWPNTNLTKVPVMPGMDIKEEARASLDPTFVLTPPEAPPTPGPETLPQKYKESSMGFEDANAMVKTTLSPVKELKMAWEAEDLHSENEKLLRR